jgi:hypothetical protein
MFLSTILMYVTKKHGKMKKKNNFFFQSLVAIGPGSLGVYSQLFAGCAGLCAIILCIILNILACRGVTTVAHISDKEAAKRQKVIVGNCVDFSNVKLLL